MAAQYDDISEQFNKIKSSFIIIRQDHIKGYTLQHHLGDISGKSILDLANVLEDADGGKLKKKDTDKKTKIAIKLLSHTSDAMDYLIMRALRKEFKEHLRGDVTSSDFHIPTVTSKKF